MMRERESIYNIIGVVVARDVRLSKFIYWAEFSSGALCVL